VVLAVMVEPHLYFFQVCPEAGHLVGHAATAPFPEVYGIQASVTIPVF